MNSIFLMNQFKKTTRKLENPLRKFCRKYTKSFSSRRILEKNFKEQSPFTFIQVGANDGVSFDFLFVFLSNRNAEGIVIEPVKEYYDELALNFKYNDKIIAINKAIHPSESEILIYKIKPSAVDKYSDWVKGIASLDSNHHLKSNIDKSDIISEIVKSATFNAIVKQNPLSRKVD
jgi:FkbM family methyltransferase